jgi:hypothetical protein
MVNLTSTDSDQIQFRSERFEDARYWAGPSTEQLQWAIGAKDEMV